MKHSKISIIVPVFNVESYLSQCVQSLLAQTYKELEIVLVDDGSTDSSGFLCDELMKCDSRIIVIHKPNGGLSDARNAGLEIASGDYIGYVDSDDFIEPMMFQTLYENAQKYNADISCCRYAEVYDDGKRIPIGDNHCIYHYDGIDGLKEYLLGKKIDPFVCNKLYRSHYTQNNKTNKNIRFIKGIIGEDIPFNIQIFKQKPRVVLAGESFYNYRQARPGSICTALVSQKRIESTFRWDEIRMDIKKSFPELEIYALRRQALFYLGLYNRIIIEKNENVEVRKKLISFFCEYANVLIHNSICEKSIKGASFFLAKSPFLYSYIMKVYKKIWVFNKICG